MSDVPAPPAPRLPVSCRGQALEHLAGEAAGMIEHEMRSSTCVARGYLRLFLDERRPPSGPEARSFAAAGVAELDRVERLLDDLLLLAQHGAEGGLRVARKPVRVSQVVERAAAALGPLLERQGVELRVEVEACDACDTALADAERLEQALRNLLQNAAQWSPPNGCVRVRLESFEADAGPGLLISVEDQGPGVSAADADRIFQPFVRGAGPSGPGPAGVGLGLAICRQVIEAHGGRVHVEVGSDHGHFLVELPLTALPDAVA